MRRNRTPLRPVALAAAVLAALAVTPATAGAAPRALWAIATDSIANRALEFLGQRLGHVWQPGH